MGDGLDYWDRPKYPACRDPRCSAVRAGIPHVVDETHQAVLDALPPVQWNMRDMGDRPPRALYLRAALRGEAKARKRRRVLTVSVGLVWCCGVGVLVALRLIGAV
jgi:hypothetical protein